MFRADVCMNNHFYVFYAIFYLMTLFTCLDVLHVIFRPLYVLAIYHMEAHT